ncbi:MAG: hypothetical protein HQM02_03090, partial [Magnetococcales bacterium]|nr:hypothetical protein [Magnetococcales bacterium]
MRILPSNKALWLPESILLLVASFLLLIVINLLNFNNHHEQLGSKYNYYLLRKQSLQARNLSNAVSQVQNQLTDISATLGLNQLDQGFSRAQEAVEIFHTGVANLRGLLIKGPLTRTPLDLDALTTRFDLYYAQGIEMANAYIQHGTMRGNEKMKVFDAQADQLREILADWSGRQEQQTEHWQQKWSQNQEP